MTGPGILALTTDFGTDGPYVAALKGVILSLAPDAKIVDVSHAIAPQNVLEGAFVLAEVVDAFPAGTVHLGVVDPGVGTSRRLIASRIGGHWFVVPDNGLITGAARLRHPEVIHEITNPLLRRPTVAPTFHGRDILAPAAAHLLLGGDPADLGPVLADFVTLRNFRPSEDEAGLIGEVIYRDVFGNLITNIAADQLVACPDHSWTIEIAGQHIAGLTLTYGDGPTGALIALIGGTGWLEVAVVNGDAGQQLSAGPGTTIWARRATRPT